jgi:hypothetical protein
MSMPPDSGDRKPPAPIRTTGPKGFYRKEGDLRVVELTVEDVGDLFHEIDPSPLRDKDLRPEIETYLVTAVEEAGGPHKAKIVIQMPAEAVTAAAQAIVTEGLHNFFTYRAWVQSRDLTRLFRIGYLSLAIGLTFLFLCLSLRQIIPGNTERPLRLTMSEGLMVVGWVAMWRPLEIFLYDWWPMLRRRRLYAALATVVIECRAVQA